MAYTMQDDAAYEVQKQARREKIKVFFSNARHFHHRVMANFLKKRGWVVFYLEEEHRDCAGECWLKLYRAEQKGQ